VKRARLKPGTFYQKPKKLHDLGLTWKALLAYHAIAFHCDENLVSWPSMSTMGDIVGVHVDTVRDGVNELAKAGVITKAGRGKDGVQWSNKYAIQSVSRWGKPAPAGDAPSAEKHVFSQDGQGYDQDYTLPEYCGLPEEVWRS
jgi:hypothetical protein